MGCPLPWGSGNKSKIGAVRRAAGRGCVSQPARWELSGLAGLLSTESGLRLGLSSASTRSAISEDKVWAPRAPFTPRWASVSAMHAAVEDHSSSHGAAQLMPMAPEAWSSRLSAKGTLVFLQFPPVQKCFLHCNASVWRPAKPTRKTNRSASL